MNSENLTNQEKLQELLAGLCSSREDQEILAKLCSEVVYFTEDKVTFREFSFSYVKSTNIVPDKSLPKSFAEIATMFNFLLWDGGGPDVGFQILEDGTSAADGYLFDEVDSDEVEKIRESLDPETINAFAGGQNALFFNPMRKLSNGEPALAFIDHECAEWVEVESVDSLNYKQILLRMLSDCMIYTEYIPEICF